ncbi:MAG: alpha/beta hydrolase [Candidatus Eisenbacteria bacterium]
MGFRAALGLTLLPVVLSCGGSGSDTGEMIDVGTHRLHIDQAGTGAPAVVIDVGIGGRSEEWGPIRERIAEVTRILTYERAGYGRSEPGPLPRHSGRVADELRALLTAASVPGPYVLVGHSLGGLNVQVFAARYPEEVAGMVLLDPPPLGWLLGESFPDLRRMAEAMTNEWQAAADRGLASTDPRARSEAEFLRAVASEHREMLGESAALAAAIGSFGEIPLTVIASGVPNPLFGEAAEEYQGYWIEESRAVAARSTRGEFVLARESSHRLHEEASKIVEETVLAMVRDLRGE